MKRSSAADSLVRKWEGYHRALPDGSCAAYPDVATGGEPWTIGFGTTRYVRDAHKKFGRSKVRKGDVLTRAEAEAELDAELDEIEDALNDILAVRVTQGMFDALVSFAFNVGIQGAEKQLRRVNRWEFEECAASFDLYVYANGRPFQGLINRRNEEEALFRSQGLDPSKPTKPTEPDEPKPNGRPYAPCPVPVPWIGGELRRGQDSPEIYWLQCALIGLGYLRKPAAGELVGDVFNEHVEHAVETFQMHESLAVDGIVGPKTRAAIEKALTKARAPKPAEPKPEEGVATLRAIGGTYTGAWAGLKKLVLTIGGEEFAVCSGQARAQTFRRPQDPRSFPGNMEPIPQGRYSIGDIAWANGKDSYEGTHGAGLGPVWVPLDATFSDDRGAFGFHLDSNIGGSPGSAGCVVFRDLPDLKRFVAALRKHDPRYLDVIWGL